jgi:hypothetical protein
MSPLRLRDPFLLFSAGGLLLFLVAQALEDFAGTTHGVREVHVPADEVARLEDRFVRQHARSPTPEERAALVEDYVTEYVLFEQAVAWDLHRNDVVVRRRLMERLRILFSGYEHADFLPTDPRSYFEANAASYQEPAQLAFRQVFVDADLHGAEAARERAVQLYDRLARGETVTGDPWYMAPTEVLRPIPRIAALLGRDFAEAAEALMPGQWYEPIRSGFGYHLVFIEQRVASRTPTFEEISDRVWIDFQQYRDEQAFAAFKGRLRAEVRVVLDPS